MNLNHHSSLLQTGSRQELRDLVRSQLQALLKQKNFEGVTALLVPVKPVDIAEAIEGLPEAMQAIAFRFLSKDEAIEVYEYLDPSVQQALLEQFKRQDVLDIVDKMSPDNRARLFDELPAKVVRRLIEQLSPIEREAMTLLLGYQPDTAGRLMTPKYVSLKENLTVAQALERIRSLAVAIAVGMSLFAIAVLASVSGSALPFLFRSLGLDPALMSAPFITTAVDVLGVFIYLSLARLILQI